MVLRHGLARRPVEGELPVSQQDCARAEALDGRRVVRDEHDRPAALLELEDLAEALALELLVADREHLVEQEHVDLEVRGDREAEPHVHARGVRSHGHVDEPLELRERDDLLQVPVDRGPLEAEDGAVQVDVLAPRELRMEARAELEQRPDSAADRDPPLGRLHDPGDQAEEGRLARAVPADQADRPARLDCERDARERVDDRAAAPPAGDEHLLQRAHGLGVHAEATAGALDPDLAGTYVRHGEDGSAALRRTTPASTATNAGSAFGMSIRSNAMTELGGAVGRLDVEVPADLEVVGDEADRDTRGRSSTPSRVERLRGGRGCPAAAMALRSATPIGTRTTSPRPRPPLRRAARSRGAGPRTDLLLRALAQGASGP